MSGAMITWKWRCEAKLHSFTCSLIIMDQLSSRSNSSMDSFEHFSTKTDTTERISDISTSSKALLSLNDILALSEESQLKFDKNDGGLYSNSYKSTGSLSSLVAFTSFIARFFSPAAQQTFKNAHEEVKQLISQQYGKKAAAAFETSFASRARWGSPLTTGSIKRFLSTSPEVAATYLGSLEKRYDKELAATYQKGFLPPGKTVQGTRSEVKEAFFKEPASAENITICSGEVKSLQEMGFYCDDSSQSHNALLPEEGFVHIAGEKERSALLTDFLYLPSAKIENIKAFITTANETVEKLTSDANNSALSEEQRRGASASLPQAQENLDKLQEITKDFRTWPADRLAAFVGLYRLTSPTTAAIDKPEEIKSWHEYNWDDCNPTEILAIVSQATAEAQQKQIKFNRVRIDIPIPGLEGDSIVACSDDKTYEENFTAFKTRLEQLVGHSLPDSQVTEILQLFSSENLSAGFASGSNLETGLLLGSAQSYPGEMNTFTISYNKEKAFFDFAFDSGKSYLTSLQTPIESNSFSRVLMKLGDQPFSLEHAPSPEARCKDFISRLPLGTTINNDLKKDIIAAMEALNPKNPKATEEAIQSLLKAAGSDITFTVELDPNASTTATLTSNLTQDADGNKLEIGNRTQEQFSHLPHFETIKKFTYRYTPNQENTKGAVDIIDSRQAYWRIGPKDNSAGQNNHSQQASS